MHTLFGPQKNIPDELQLKIGIHQHLGEWTKASFGMDS